MNVSQLLLQATLASQAAQEEHAALQLECAAQRERMTQANSEWERKECAWNVEKAALLKQNASLLERCAYLECRLGATEGERAAPQVKRQDA